MADIVHWHADVTTALPNVAGSRATQEKLRAQTQCRRIVVAPVSCGSRKEWLLTSRQHERRQRFRSQARSMGSAEGIALARCETADPDLACARRSCSAWPCRHGRPRAG